MKNLFLCALTITAIPAIFFGHTEPKMENLYPESGVVINVDHENDFITFEVFNGNQFSFYDDIEGWECGDIVSAIMDSQGTGLVYDDIVVKAQYSGWLENGSLPENRK